MQSRAATVADYLAELPADRRAVVAAVREVFLANRGSGCEEGMSYGMIGCHVPHGDFPGGYHCDPSKPLPFAGLASKKGHFSLHLMCLSGDAAERERFESAGVKAGKKLDAGKCCVRFRTLDDLTLDVLARSLRRTPAAKHVANYQGALAASGTRKAAAKATSARRKSALAGAGAPSTRPKARPAPARRRAASRRQR